MENIKKYPRTKHIRGSRKSGDDFELEDIPFENLIGKYVVFEEKVDGANCQISFSEDGDLLLGSRGHYLLGGPREKQFIKLKIWANSLKNDLYDILGKRYIMYGEDLECKHTIYYDLLPDYFLEFDVYDKEKSCFLSTKARNKLLEGLNYNSVPILYSGPAISVDHLTSFIKKSLFKSDNWVDSIKFHSLKMNIDYQDILKYTDQTNLAEGIYIKVETEEETIDRYKFVRFDFVNKLINDNSHWLKRILFPNNLRGTK
jgi:ATP-dependent RNA circularization protein (DNA/RNA ligase family)